LREDRKRAEDLRKAEARRAARRAALVWAKCSLDGESDYLVRKGVIGHGVRYSPSGAVAIPMLDAAGVIHGLQIIRSRQRAKDRPEKEFWPQGLAKKGHFHLIGVPAWIVLVAEGYATAATIYEATGHPIAVAFDAGNLAPVAQALRARYRSARILICADDDSFAKCSGCGARVALPEQDRVCPACSAEHGRVNTGVAAASTAAVAVTGAFVAPRFADESGRRAKFLERGIKLTDFNDLATIENLIVVRNQIEARKSELGWREPTTTPTTATSGAGGAALNPIATLSELLTRFALVYAQGGTVFDRQEHKLVAQSDLRDACLTRQIYRAWAEHPDRCIVRTENVGFDPGDEDPQITCNLWAGWPTTSAPGTCDKLLDLLRHMCSGDASPEKLYRWVLSWVAYPIQHPGAKMKTALVVHGPQGTGKNMFFEAIMAIYGRYGAIIDQSAIEDRFNDWASRKLFLIADEVIARSDLYHVKNRLKAFITGIWIRINPKGLPAYDERNHVNLVFLSNEIVPVALEEDDRRHAVIWTPEKLPAQFYREAAAEIAAGGIAALHDHLLHLDLGDFSESTPPPCTDAKNDLIDDGLDVVSRFIYQLQMQEIAIPYAPALSTDLYKVYK
jgi:putative DNA primase/helicase